MSENASFIHHLKLLIAQDKLDQAILDTLEFLENHSEEYLRNIGLQYMARWDTLNELMEDESTTEAQKQAWTEEIRQELVNLLNLVAQQPQPVAHNNAPQLTALVDVQPLDFSLCLRPAFTQKIARKLLSERTSINVYQAKGSGKKRLYDDLKQVLAHVPQVKIVSLNFKLYQHNFGALLADLQKQLHPTSKAMPKSIAQICQGIEKHPYWYVVMITHYEAILGNPNIDKAFTPAFVNEINALKNKPNVSLLVATPKPHIQYSLFFQEQIYGTSWLDLRLEQLPELSHDNIAQAFAQKLPQGVYQWLQNNRSAYQLILQELMKSPVSYALLCFFIDRLNEPAPLTLSFEEQMNQWLKRFREEQKRSGYKKVNALPQTIQKVSRAIGLDKVNTPWATLLKWLGKTNKK